MCNIAGYIGKQHAAPILLEMLRKQQPYDGDMSTGVATIFEGKLYYKKIVGDVDAFLEQIDLNELPGTIGIAHSRPGGDPKEGAFHPYISPDGKMALVTNGTGPVAYENDWNNAAARMEREGYSFTRSWDNPTGKFPKLASNGNRVMPSDLLMLMVYDLLRSGSTPEQALATVSSEVFSDKILVFVHEDHPNQIFISRTLRPMYVAMETDAIYLVTAPFGFPTDLVSEPFQLPLSHSCAISSEGIFISPHRVNKEGDNIEQITPYTYAEAYHRFEEILRTKEVYFDELEFAVGREMRDLWPGGHTYVQHAPLIYDLLWQFDREGRLQRKMRIQPRGTGTRHRWYFSLKD